MVRDFNQHEYMGLDLTTNGTNWGFKGKNYLFLIAIDKYKYWTPLRTTVKDVQEFAHVLTSRYQFEQSDIYLLKDAEATEKNILTGFRHMAKKVTDQDNLIIYYSGHGHFIDETGYWIPVNANTKEEDEDEFINTAIIADKLRTINSLHTFLIIDACFSERLINQLRGSSPAEGLKSRRVFTSGKGVVPDGIAGGNSPFARVLLMKLMHNIDRYIYASKLIVDVRESVEQESQQRQSPMDARIFNSKDEGGDFVFHLKLTEPEIWASVTEKNTVDAYEKFAEQFPNGKHFNDAKVKSKRLRDENGKETYQAEKDKWKEEKEWEFAQRLNTFISYQNFVQLFPLSKNVNEAEKKMIEFDNIAFNALNLKLSNKVQPLSFRQKIDMCIYYFDNFPAAPNNTRVKQIKDAIEIKRLQNREPETKKNWLQRFMMFF